jgi:hypothetical protein
MLKQKIFKSKFLAVGLTASLSLLLFPLTALSTTPSSTGAMIGFVFGEDMKSPVENAVVKIRNIKDGTEFQSTTTDKTGLYAIKDIKEGRYILGITTPKSSFNFKYQVMVKANEMAKLSLALKPGAPLPAGDESNNNNNSGFFSSPGGIALLIGGGAILLYGGYQLLGGEGGAESSTRR